MEPRRGRTNKIVGAERERERSEKREREKRRERENSVFACVPISASFDRQKRMF